jgi:preprotein translocase subunit YajC
MEMLREKEDSLKLRLKEKFDKHHGVRELVPGDKVLISNRGSKGVVEGEVQERSYEVTSGDSTFCRYQKDLIWLTSETRTSAADDTGNQETDSSNTNRSEEEKQ